MPRQFLADFVSRASCWFSHDAPGVPADVIQWVLAAEHPGDYFYREVDSKFGAYETAQSDSVVFLRRPPPHEIAQALEDYRCLVISRVSALNLPDKYLMESILAELPDPEEFQAFVDGLFDDADSISEVSDSSYVSHETGESDAELLEDFM